jgi:predicted nucleic acid-binding protein
MFKKIAITAIALAVSAPAFAMTDDQLARSVGVEPGVYTTAQLGELSSATEANDYNRLINFFDIQKDAGVSRSADNSDWIATPKQSRGSDR